MDHNMKSRKQVRVWSVFIILTLAVVANVLAQQDSRPIELNVDISEVTKRVLHSKLTMPVTPGPLVLLYPKWIPGEHGPTGPIVDLAGLEIRTNGQTLPWYRDAIDLYAFHCRVPEGVSNIEISMDYLATPPSVGGLTDASSSTAKLAIINWNQLLLYPKGEPADEISYQASLRLPEGWLLATALPMESQIADRTVFHPVSLTTLIDSPVLCGEHLQDVNLGPEEVPSHFLHIACDAAAGLKLDPAMKSHLDRLVVEAHSMFGWYPYDAYHFLLALSDHIVLMGMEHHESSDNRLPEVALTDESLHVLTGFLLAHEFVHVWNGKYRRPADMTTADYHEPKRTNLLWVYEGLTQYLSFVLAVRSGLWTEEEYRDMVAAIADWAQNQRGRSWRSLEDTAVAAHLLFEARMDWSSWRRSVDFYDEGVLLWLEVDTIIREETHGGYSLDDFCRQFFGQAEVPALVVPYTFEELMAELGDIAEYDWHSFFMERVMSVAPGAPLGGVTRGGWQLSYADTPSDAKKSFEIPFEMIDMASSIGVLFQQDGSILDIVPDKAAHRAGMGPGVKVIGINWRRWSESRLQDAIAATRDGKEGLSFLVENGDFFESYQLEYQEGLMYPRLVRDESKPNVLGSIMKPHSLLTVPR